MQPVVVAAIIQKFEDFSLAADIFTAPVSKAWFWVCDQSLCSMHGDFTVGKCNRNDMLFDWFLWNDDTE